MRTAAVIINSAMGVRSCPSLPGPSKDLTDRYFLPYLLPNDETENDRLDVLHEMCLQVLHRKLYLGPIKSPQRVINLATGTGIWAIDFCKFVEFSQRKIQKLTHCSGQTSPGRGKEYYWQRSQINRVLRLAGLLQVIGCDLSLIQPTL